MFNGLSNLDMDIAIPTEDGRWVSEAHERIARIIQDYDPELFLAYIPPDRREPGDVPFAILHCPAGRESYIVFTVEHCDERILERLWATDNRNGDVLNRLDAHNAALEAVKLKKELDVREERAELVQSIVRSSKSVYKHDGITYQ